MLYAGGLGNDGTNGQGQRYKPIDNEIPDSANVQANPGQGADEPQPVRNAGTPNNNGRHQQQLNLGKSLLSTIHTSFNLLSLYEYTCIFLILLCNFNRWNHSPRSIWGIRFSCCHYNNYSHSDTKVILTG